ncbi:hypothetical protein SERLA73DRAFT_69411 [Serpula lacrymans var. lacrymans S7.3]|uniref:Uncharacterized protein n=1 Tax=Serpula lacrymans var. lacrymans (strain S7.3) TaxID=936435 RepID=F8PKA0_SERL3|nr:hypothetical protein SERLA73DRAFT_69411 [Serpula lacrymans var. lacrymans S7.3]
MDTRNVSSNPVLLAAPREQHHINHTAHTLPVRASIRSQPLTKKEPSLESHRPNSCKTAAVKVEPATESVVPYKRLSDTSFSLHGVKHEEHPYTLTMSLPSIKRQKLEHTKSPLARMDNNTSSSYLSHALQPAIQSPGAEEARVKMMDLQTEIVRAQSELQRLAQKSRLSMEEVQQEANLVRQIQHLRSQELEYNGTLPNMTHSAFPSGDPHVNDTLDEDIATALLESREKTPALSFQSPQPLASGSGVPLERASNLFFDSTDPGQSSFPHYMPIEPIQSVVDDQRFDDDGDFYGRGKDTFLGPVAKADDIEKFLRSAGNAELFDGNASVDTALEKLGLRGMYQLLPGMSVSLMPHQLIGVAWALDKEHGSEKGGVLGDEMGLGKARSTVQITAVMVINASRNPICKTNLIVAPTALLDQWQLEIDMKTNNNMKCLIYHGSNKPKNKADIMRYDVVLTTYHTLAQEWPDYEAEQMLQEKRRKLRKKNQSFIASDSEEEIVKPKKKKKQLGLLFQMNWYRVILDEAQNIRNRKTRNSRCVTELDATYRWCLTGTPIINGLIDAYPLFRFLKLRPWYDWTEFNGHISKLEKKNPKLASARLQSIFRVILLRRKKDSELDGKRLIELPPKNVEMEKLTFSQEERDIYKMVEARSQATFNRYLRAGTVLKNYTQVLVMLLRLRQICSHPALIQEDGVALVGPDDVCADSSRDPQQELARARRLVSAQFVDKLKHKYKEAALRHMQEEKDSTDATIDDEECPVCMDVFTDAVITPCAHTFCRECLLNVLNTPHVQDMDDPNKYKADEKPCPSCRGPVSHIKIFAREAFEPSDSELNGDEKHTAKAFEDTDDEMVSIFNANKRPRRLMKRRTFEESERDDDDRMSDFIVQSDEEDNDAERHVMKKRLGKRRAIVLDSDDDMDSEAEEVIYGKRDSSIPKEQVKMMPKFLPSTKMKKMMEHLKKWAEENAGEKTLIISQWTQCLLLVSDYLTENGILHVKYQGDMNRAKRDQAVRVFMAKDKAQVMLMSLKCGGVGLNLTRANRVISLDLGWSEAIESQAFDRVHRLGQTKEVFVQRLVIADTVEDRVLALQERKQNLADGSLGEGKGKNIGRLSVRELANSHSIRSGPQGQRALKNLSIRGA